MSWQAPPLLLTQLKTDYHHGRLKQSNTEMENFTFHFQRAVFDE